MSTAIGGLETDTSYQVQVRALNGETPSEWSPTGTGRTAEPEPALIRNVAVVNGPGADGVWTTGERVEAEVRYSRPVAVEQPDCWTYDADGTCRPPGPFVALAFRTAGHPGYGYGVSHALATYEGGSRTRVLRFAYTVGAAEDGAGNVVVADDGLLLRGATIRTLEGGDGASRYTNTRVMQVTVEKPAGGAWTAGDRVRIKVRFAGPVPYSPPDEPVNLDEVVVDKTGGTPSIGVRLADALDRPRPRTAFYAGGSGTNTLVFEYEVAAGDGRVDVAEVVADSLARNGATIRNEAGYDAELEHLGSVWTTWHDVEIPRVKMSVRGGGREHEGGTLAFTVELEEASVVPLRAKYATADGTARAGRDYKAWSGAVYFEPDETRKTVRVPLLADIGAGGRGDGASQAGGGARELALRPRGGHRAGRGAGHDPRRPGPRAGAATDPGGAADGALRAGAVRARRGEPVHGADCLQRGGQDRQPHVPRPRHRGDGGPCNEGAQGERSPGPVGGDGRAGIVRGRVGLAAPHGRLRRGGGAVHR